LVDVGELTRAYIAIATKLPVPGSAKNSANTSHLAFALTIAITSQVVATTTASAYRR